MLEKHKQTKGRSNMRQYPIWIDTHNPSYANQFSKSMGVENSSSSDIKIGTSAKNSYEFVKTRIEHKLEDDGSRIYNFYVDNELMKSAFYNGRDKIAKMSLIYTAKDREDELKSRYFSKWKKEEQDAEQKMRNERYAERLRVNGGY